MKHTTTRQKKNMSEVVVLISGNQWVPEGFFQKFYMDKIREEFAKGSRFVVGAAKGLDYFSQEELRRLCESSNDDENYKRVTVFNKEDKDGRVCDKFALVNGFPTYPARDMAMARVATRKIVTLAQYGGATGGSLVPLLAVNLPSVVGVTPSDAPKILDVLRENSEPWSEEVIENYIKPLYEKLYPKITTSACSSAN